MAVYQRLNLGAEGGIIDVINQAEQENCAVLCIGLGGTGYDCLKNLKSKIHNRIRPDNSTKDNPYPVKPEYEHIKFLAVDTDSIVFRRDNSDCPEFSRLTNREFFDISFVNTNGRGMTRQEVRNIFFQHANHFYTVVINLIKEAMAGLSNPQIYIHIFAGTGGCTGSAIFLDVCYLIREALRNNELFADIFGYCFLPDTAIVKGLPSQAASYVKINGYTFLSELDYCMNFPNNGDLWKQEYPGVGVISNDSRPVNLCHLISAIDKDGNVICDGYHYAINVVSEYIINILVKGSGNTPITSVVANFDFLSDQAERNSGATYKYIVLGASTAYIPYKQILTYLASGVFSRMKGLLNNQPDAAGVDQFVKQNQLEFNDIIRKLTDGCVMFFEVPDYKWQEVRNNTKLIIDCFEEQYAQFCNKLWMNYEELSRGLEDYYVVNNANDSSAKSVIYFINSKLQSLAADPDYGPFYASALLRSTSGTDIIAKVKGVMAMAEESFAHHQHHETMSGGLYDEYKRTDEEFMTSIIINGSSRYKAFITALQNLMKNRAYIETYKAMINISKKLLVQLFALSDKFMAPFRDALHDLYDTFKENSRYLDGVLIGAIVPDNYEIPIITLSDIKPQLDQTLENMDIKKKFRELIESLLTKEGIAACTSGYENAVCVIVNRFFADLFHDYSNTKITQYIEQYSLAMHPAPLAAKCVEIMDRLYSMTNPVYWVSPTYQINTAVSLGYVTYPQTSSELNAASYDFLRNYAPGVIYQCPGCVFDRISVIRSFAGVPVYGYQGISQYENMSVSSSWNGLHLYEGKAYVDGKGVERKDKDWRHLPSPVPYSLMNNNNHPFLLEMADKAAALYRKAVDMDVIFSPEGKPMEYYFRTVTDQYISNIISIKDEAIRKTKEDRKKAVTELEKLKDNKQYNLELIKINNSASQWLDSAQRERVRIDHFVKSPVIQEKVKKEIERIESIDAVIEELRIRDDQDSFLEGVISGVISFSRETGVVMFSHGDEKIILSDPETESFAQSFSLYHAMTKYMDLDPDIKEQIVEESEKQLNSFPLSDEVLSGYKKLKEYITHTEDYINSDEMKQTDDVDPVKVFLADTADFLEINSLLLGLDN